ncbi:MAG: AI-2E family transporter, partial [Solirubrobacteraceae bacterium]
MSELARQRLRTAMVVAAILLLLYILWVARAALVPFLIGTVIAYLLAPVVNFMTLLTPLNRMSVKVARGISIA